MSRSGSRCGCGARTPTGGYQVVKKWLSYREGAILGRPLTSAEVREVSSMIRRIAALIVLQSFLDANYKSVVAKS